MWPFRYRAPCRTDREQSEQSAHVEDAQRAIAQARKADAATDQSIAEMKSLVERIRAQRERNHFSAAMWETMRRK